MENSLKYCLNLTLIFCLAIMMNACQNNVSYYKKEFSETERIDRAEKLLSGMGYRYYYQGSSGESAILEEAGKLNINHAEVWRERGIPYLKRGIASGYYEPYTKCAKLDPINWQGYKGYCTLYFYRDYESALKDFDEVDALTPGVVDYPQATSIDYMRSLCYLGMENADSCLIYINKHIEAEIVNVGLNYIASPAFIIKAKAHLLKNETAEAQAVLVLGTQAHDRNADIEYHLAKLYFETGQKAKAKTMAAKAKSNFKEGYANGRPYVEEFFQVYLTDIEVLQEAL